MNKNSGAFKYFDKERGPDLRTRPPGVRKTFEVSKMWEVHQEIVRRIFLGQKNSDIANDLGISPVTVSYTRNSRVVQDKLKLMAGARDADVVDLGKEIREKAPKALKLLEEILDGTGLGTAAGPNLRAKTAENWLDRAGYPAQSRGGGITINQHFTAPEIDAIKKRALENGIVFDTEKADNEQDMESSRPLISRGAMG